MDIMTRLRMQANAEFSTKAEMMLEAADEIERLRHENAEMRRTFGSHPLFAEKDAEIGRLKAALEKAI